jgi:hypothetical protein
MIRFCDIQDLLHVEELNITEAAEDRIVRKHMTDIQARIFTCRNFSMIFHNIVHIYTFLPGALKVLKVAQNEPYHKGGR